MNGLWELIKSLILNLRPWIVVTPWEQAIRVRLGKNVKLLNAGFHLKIPIVDSMYVQSIRMRMSQCGRQTITSLDGKTVTVGASVCYSISDIEKLYRGMHHAEDTIQGLARAAVTQYISTHSYDRCTPKQISEALGSQALNLEQYGITCGQIVVNDLAMAKTYRLLGDYSGPMWGSTLTTDNRS